MRRVLRVLRRPTLWFCACNLLAAALTAQCANPTQIPNQTISSGSLNFPNNNALTASNVVIGGSASVTFVAGNCIQLAPGFNATAGAAGTTFRAWLETAPSVVSAAPSSGSGSAQQFTFTASSPYGFNNLADVYALFNTSVSVGNACYIRYNRASNLLYLADNAGSGWGSGITPGSSGSASNSQCGISGSGSSVSGIGNQLAVTVAVTFQGAFSGLKNGYVIAYDQAGLNSTWQQAGTWTVSAGGTQHVITSNPTDLPVTVDGVDCTTPCTFAWTPGSNHTVAAAFRQQGGAFYFSHFSGTGVRQNEEVWSDNGKLMNPVTAQSTPPQDLIVNFSDDPVAALRSCLNQSTSRFCVLANGTHEVTSTIRVNRSNVTIRGESSYRTQTSAHLVRGSAFTDELMVVNVAPSADSILIQHLTFCGGSKLVDPGSGCPATTSLPLTTCGYWQSQIHDNYVNGLPAPDGPRLCADFTISQAGLASRPGDPFSYTGPYSVTISNVAFEGATGHAVAIYPNSPQEANDIYITGSAINRSEVTGLLVGVNGEDYSDHRKCDSPGFLNDPSVHTPRNIRVDGNNGSSNGFRHNFTGALGINGARYLSLQNNLFDDNYHSPRGANSHGGTLFLDQCTDTSRIYGNTLTGPTVTYEYTEGMELWGRNIDVGAGSEATKNTFEKYYSAGITLNSASSPEIRTNELKDIPSAEPAALIVLSTRETNDACIPSFRTTQNVTISGNTLPTSVYGVVLPDKELSTNVINTIAIDSSGTVSLHPFVTLTGSVSITPAPALQQPPDQLLPRALAVQPVLDLAAPIRAIPAKCPDANAVGYSREVFAFPVGDVAGASNIKSVEGTFTPTVVNESKPAWGPVNEAQSCYFRFKPPENLAACESGGCGDLQLAESTPNYLWGESSMVGPGGGTRENSVCRIYAGSNHSRVTNVGNLLTLELDIEFLNLTKKYMYARTVNRSDTSSTGGTGSNGGTWRYWGWW
jgi:hypothetical protein